LLFNYRKSIESFSNERYRPMKLFWRRKKRDRTRGPNQSGEGRGSVERTVTDSIKIDRDATDQEGSPEKDVISIKKGKHYGQSGAK